MIVMNAAMIAVAITVIILGVVKAMNKTIGSYCCQLPDKSNN